MTPDLLDDAALAAVNLSKALGISTEAAFRNVGRTMGGFAGELGELVPELKDLSVEALRSGEGIVLLGEKFEGTAEAQRGFAETLENVAAVHSGLRSGSG